MIAALLLLIPVIGNAAEREREGRHAYRSPHWEFDSRYHHDHYYPARGYVVSVLPPGYLSITFGGGRYYFQGGVWFRASGARYVVVAPPPGIVVPVLPPAYTTVWVGGAPYWYANDVYYTQAPAGSGYVVAPPPPGYESAQVTPPPPGQGSVPPGAPAASSDTVFVYPRSGQSEAQTARDRAECSRWANGQTGYDASQPNPADPRRGDYLRALSACLEGRGYTVR